MSQQPPNGFPPPPPPGSGGPQWPSGYGLPGGGAPREHPSSGTVLALGILSIILCPILGPFAWSKGNGALNDLQEQPGAYTGEGTIKAGRICGIIGTVLIGLAAVTTIAFILAAAASGA